MSFDIESDTILSFIAAKVQDDRMHHLAKQFKIYTMRCINSLISNKGKGFSFLIPYLGVQNILFDIEPDTVL